MNIWFTFIFTKQQMIKKNVFYRNGSRRGKSRFDCKVDYDYPVLVCECFLIDQRICFCFLLTFQLNKQTKSNRTKERGRKKEERKSEKKRKKVTKRNDVYKARECSIYLMATRAWGENKYNLFLSLFLLLEYCKHFR
jgi:hypothetical protein